VPLSSLSHRQQLIYYPFFSLSFSLYLPLSHSNSLSPTHSLSLSHTHTHTHSLLLSPSLPLSPSLSLSLSLSGHSAQRLKTREFPFRGKELLISSGNSITLSELLSIHSICAPLFLFALNSHMLCACQITTAIYDRPLLLYLLPYTSLDFFALLSIADSSLILLDVRSITDPFP
jgi:hypothetical protein